MSIVLKGYRIFSQIYAGKTTVVYRGETIEARKPVVIKVSNNQYPTLVQLNQFRNQYIITKNIDSDGVVQTNALETFGNGLALVMEWGGISLPDYLASKNYISLSGRYIKEFFDLAVKITRILEDLQQNSIVHQQLQPQHFLIDPDTKQVKLTDFTLAAILPKDTQLRYNPSLGENSLSYIAPEQTGRMNCGIDHRSDLYGLGIIFYQLLVGQLPFTARDGVELAYSHLAVTPPTPARVNPQIPAAVSDIILKLLAKNPQSRYQTALGLRYDLEQCQRQWLKTKTCGEFDLGKRDVGDRLPIPAKLYGREAEVATLLAAYRRVSQGNQEIVLVAGFSGIGKTALIKQIQKSIDRQSYFIAGKFDQFQRHQPFSAIVNAFRDLIRQLQTESQASLQAWRSRLLDALGENGQIIIDVIPELENIIGVPSPAVELDTQAAQNRFNLTFINFVTVFASRKHPLIIFLDDLQWADLASLELLQLLIDQKTESLLLIGAYRNNEVNAAHPLMLKLKEIEQQINRANNQAVAMEYIHLSPLLRTALDRMIADTLACSDELALPLSDLIWQTTKGNPFFTIQLLHHWHGEGLIYFNFEQGGWQCELAQIRVLAVSDDVVEFMVQRLEKLPHRVQQVLKIAACIGNKFDLNTLAIAYNQSSVDTAIDLSTAIGAGLVLPVSQIHQFFLEPESEAATAVSNSTCFNQAAASFSGIGLQSSASLVATRVDRVQTIPYQFLHDRVQQAAYSSIPAAQKPSIHRQIGMLLAQTGVEKTNIFAIVNHLNLAIELIQSPTEKQQLAELNLKAGTKAKAATAYPSALTYFSTGLELLDLNCWQVQYELTLALSVATAEAAYLCGNFEQMELLTATILQQARSLGDRALADQIQIQAQIACGNPLGAVKIALNVLKLFGKHYPLKPAKWRIALALIRTKLAMRGRKIEDLIDLPIAKRADVIAMGKIMYTVGSPCYNTAFELVPLIALTSVSLSIKYGNTPISTYAYVSYSVILCGVLGDIEAGYRFGKLALNLVEKLQLIDQKARTMMMFNTFVRHWKEHLQASSAPLLEAYTIGLETGDLEFACYCAYLHCYHGYFLGHELTELEGKMKAYGEAIAQFGQKNALCLHRIYHQATLNLLEENPHPWVLTGEVFDEQAELRIIKGLNQRTALFDIYFLKLIFSYWFDQIEKAAEYVKCANKYIDSAISTASIPIFYFYDSLIELSRCNQSHISSQKIIHRVNRNQKKLRKWAKFSPMNYLHKFHLVEAEKHRVSGRYLQAIENYDQAIKLAQEYKYVNEQALAQELAAQFYWGWGKDQIAQLYWTDAYYSYARWGANSKLKNLVQKYPQFSNAVLYKTESNRPQPLISYPHTNLNNLNLTTVIKTVQAASEEIQIERLLFSLIEIMIKNAGAEIGYLILLGKLESETLLITANIIDGNTSIENQYLDLNNIGDRLPVSLINYVINNREPVIYRGDNLAFASDPYIIEHQTKSILCMPILNKNTLVGLLYLENNLVPNLFTNEQIELLKLLCCQTVMAIENATLYLNLKQSEQREKQKTQQLKQYLQKLQQSQKRLLKTQKKLKHDAFHDSLTDLPNRIWLTKILQKSIDTTRQNPTYQYAFLFLDLDRFKVINDSLGHLIGDELLKQVAERLKICIRHTDTVCRLGGDEFAILLERIEHHQEATIIAERIQTQLSLPFYLNQYEIYTGTSIGITFSSFNYQKPEDILRDADAAMYQAKSQGKGQYLVFDQNMQSQVAANLELENALRSAISFSDRLLLHYQPIISLSTNQLVGFEALLRWQDPNRGWISPAEFIPIAEETGLINDIGWWVIETACQQLSLWRDRFPHHPIAININLSALQLKQENLVSQLKQILNQNQLPPFCLKLEITESCLLETYSTEAQTLNQLKDLGVGICIDDFGTGYSSLSRLHQFPIDTLKIDRSFIRNLHSIAKQDPTVQTIITLAHSLNMDVVAEGVETIEQLQQLQQLGCEYVQGYLFSKPVNSEAATELITLFI